MVCWEATCHVLFNFKTKHVMCVTFFKETACHVLFNFKTKHVMCNTVYKEIAYHVLFNFKTKRDFNTVYKETAFTSCSISRQNMWCVTRFIRRPIVTSCSKPRQNRLCCYSCHALLWGRLSRSVQVTMRQNAFCRDVACCTCFVHAWRRNLF